MKPDSSRLTMADCLALQMGTSTVGWLAHKDCVGFVADCDGLVRAGFMVPGPVQGDVASYFTTAAGIRALGVAIH